MKRFVLATLCGTLMSAALLSFDALFIDHRATTILQALHDITAPTEVIAVILVILLVFGALPTLLIGAILRSLHRASPITLVLTPALLFSLILTEVATRTSDMLLIFDGIPAILTGASAMFAILIVGKKDGSAGAVS